MACHLAGPWNHSYRAFLHLVTNVSFQETEARRPRNLWSPFLPDLADGFRQLCAYSAMYEPVGTVDHFVSFAEDRGRAYDWSNDRFASGWINAKSKKAPLIAVAVKKSGARTL